MKLIFMFPKKLLSLFLCAVLLFFCVPLTTLATDNGDTKIFVGGVELKSGEYLGTDGNVSNATPVGGYAYFQVIDNVSHVTLNNYAYEGKGNRYEIGENGNVIEEQALLYSTNNTIVNLEGTNTFVVASDDFPTYISGIMIENNCTIEGKGSLEIEAYNCIFVYSKLVILSGEITITTSQDGGGIYANNLEILGGNIKIDSGGYGVSAGNNLEISGGDITIDAGYSGIMAYNSSAGYEDGILVNCCNINISGGNITINADEAGINAFYGNLNISGGDIKINADEAGIIASIYADDVRLNADEAGIGKLEISGGDIKIDTEGYGVRVLNGLDILGGNISIRADIQALMSKSTTIENCTTLASSNSDGQNLVEYLAENNDNYKYFKSTANEPVGYKITQGDDGNKPESAQDIAHENSNSTLWILFALVLIVGSAIIIILYIKKREVSEKQI